MCRLHATAPENFAGPATGPLAREPLLQWFMNCQLPFSRSLRFAWFARVLLPMAFASGLFAQAPEVQVDLTGKRVVISEGKETLLQADKAGPGDVIQYEAVYRNAGKAAANNLAATVPIPQGMALLAGSAQPAAEEASLDGKNFSSVPLMREARNDAGVLEQQPVPLAQYRALRWNLAELAPGKPATVVLRAQLLTSAAGQ